MEGKQALLAVSFGTSHLDTLEKTIAAIERDMAAALPGYALRRAFTSGMILRKLRERDGLEIDDVPAALARLEAEGFARVVLQPTHIINGEEYDKLMAQARPWADRLEIRAGLPLLTSVQDARDVAAALMAELEAPAPDEALVFMGHGSGHHANAAYAQLEYVLHDAGWPRAFIGTVEGYPELPEVLRRVRELGDVRRVRLQPLMVVAGDHAKNDMAGEDDDSWRSVFARAGYQVDCRIRGLGEYARIRALFAAHARAACACAPLRAGAL